MGVSAGGTTTRGSVSTRSSLSAGSSRTVTEVGGTGPRAGIGSRAGSSSRHTRGSSANAHVTQTEMPTLREESREQTVSCCDEVSETAIDLPQDQLETEHVANPMQRALSQRANQISSDLSQKPPSFAAETTAERQIAAVWYEAVDPASGSTYYINKETEATSWVHPEKQATTGTSFVAV